jgi:hypothetical protein
MGKALEPAFSAAHLGQSGRGPRNGAKYPLGRERRPNLLVGLARIFVYYIGYINVCAGFFDQ